MMKYVFFFAFSLLLFFSACQGRREYVKPEPDSLMRAQVDGQEWKTNEVVLKINRLTGHTVLEGWLMNEHDVASSIHIALPDSSLTTGDYHTRTTGLQPSFYEDTFQKCWNTTRDYTFRIDKIENGCIWGSFSFTGADTDAEGTARKEIVNGVFENVKIERIQ